MRPLKVKNFCFAVMFAAIFSFEFMAQAQEDSAVPPAAEAESEAVKRLEQSMFLTKLADEGDQLLAAGSVDVAKTRYQQVFSQTPTSGPLAALHEHASRGLGSVMALQARYAEERKDYQQARQLWEQALGYDSANTTYQAAYERVKERGKSLAEEYPSNTAVTQDLKDKVDQIQKLVFQGDSYVQTGQYERAVARYKAVLMIDPYNNQARERIKKTEKTMERMASLRRDQRKREFMDRVSESWLIKPSASVEQSKAIVVDTEESNNTANIYDKLQSIIIPECKFTDADLADILNYLQDQSKVLDPKKEGINIVFKGEPTDASEGGAAAAPSSQMIRSLTLDLTGVQLAKVLDFIQSLSTYLYKVEENAVYVFPNTETSEVMLVKTFSVPPMFFNTRVSLDNNTTGSFETRTVNMVTADVKKELVEKGVKFAANASAAYLPKTAKLVVRNTLDQLNLIDQLLSKQANVSTQIEISSKFLEFSEDKLKDLSFNYRAQGAPYPPTFGLLPDKTMTVGDRSGGLNPAETSAAAGNGGSLNFNWFPEPVAAKGNIGFGTAIRNSGNMTGNQLESLLGIGVNRTPNMISFSTMVSGIGAQLLITALQSEFGADLMSEPKITAFNGQKVKIRATRELRYPTQWDAPKVPQTSGGGGGGGGGSNLTTSVTVIPSNPTNFIMRDIGVTLDVTANATPDRRIDLNIKPDVTEFDGFINYGGDATTLGADNEIATVVQGVALTPVFSRRFLETKIQVMDGQTVIMGGFIRSDNQEIEDKVPVLGDIPLLGRMFRSKSSQMVKRNLVIFLTARMIKPDGKYEYMTESEKELAEVTGLPVMSRQ